MNLTIQVSNIWQSKVQDILRAQGRIMLEKIGHLTEIRAKEQAHTEQKAVPMLTQKAAITHRIAAVQAAAVKIAMVIIRTEIIAAVKMKGLTRKMKAGLITVHSKAMAELRLKETIIIPTVFKTQTGIQEETKQEQMKFLELNSAIRLRQVQKEESSWIPCKVA